MRLSRKGLTVITVLTLFAVTSVVFWPTKAMGRKSSDQPSSRSSSVVSGESKQTTAVLEIEVSDHPPKGNDGRIAFRVVADDRLPENNAKSVIQVSTNPYLNLQPGGSTNTPIPGRKEWMYSAQVIGDDVNLLKIRASICESIKCTGILDKTRERIVDIGSSKFDEYAVVVHPNQLVAARVEQDAFIDLQKEGHVVTPTSTIKLHVAARDGCVSFQANDGSLAPGPSINLVIDSISKKSQTEYFRIVPATLPPDNCAIDVAVYDDEKQRPTPLPAQLVLKTSPRAAILMSFSGCIIAFGFLVWRRTRRHIVPIVSWPDVFEVAAKGFLAVLVGLVLTKTDFFGITVDKTSANGFFTTGFLLGFIPLDTIFDRILHELGVSPPAAQTSSN
jgi:hypothetical protein